MQGVKAFGLSCRSAEQHNSWVNDQNAKHPWIVDSEGEIDKQAQKHEMQPQESYVVNQVIRCVIIDPENKIRKIKDYPHDNFSGLMKDINLERG